MRLRPQAALDYARALSYPRRVGTPGEARAVTGITTRLAELGYEVEHQSFECAAGADAAFAALIAAGQILVTLTFLAWSVGAWVAVVPAAALAALLVSASTLSRRLAAAMAALEVPAWWRGAGRRYRTTNIIARAALPALPDAPRLYLVAHWDSKSQAIPLPARMLLIGVSGAAGLCFAALSLLRAAFPGLTSPAAVFGLLALVAGVPVLFVYLAGSGNASPGALDNASGVGLVLHLAEVLAAQPAPLVAVTFLITGAEELGLLGAWHYVRAARRTGEFDGPGRVCVLNFDGVGTDGALAYVGARTTPLAGLVRAACASLALPLRRLPLAGALFDHLPFADAGLDAVSLVTTGAAARAIHTPADTPERLSEAGFRAAGEVALRVIRDLAPASPRSSG